MKIKRRYDIVPTNDYIFQCVYGNEGSEEITKDFLNTIIDEKIEDIEISHEAVTDKNILDEKVVRLDVKAKVNGNIYVDLEMQMTKNKYMTSRILYNWSKLFAWQIVEGESYNKLHKAICVLIIDYEDELIESVPKLVTQWRIKEISGEKMLTELFEIYIISLRKLKILGNERAEEKLVDLKEREALIPWLKFLKDPKSLEVDIMENNESIKKAKEIYESVISDAERVRIAEMRAEKASIYETGLDDGEKKGKEEATIEIAKNMLNKKMDINLIIELTGLTKEEIEKL